MIILGLVITVSAVCAGSRAGEDRSDKVLDDVWTIDAEVPVKKEKKTQIVFEHRATTAA